MNLNKVSLSLEQGPKAGVLGSSGHVDDKVLSQECLGQAIGTNPVGCVCRSALNMR